MGMFSFKTGSMLFLACFLSAAIIFGCEDKKSSNASGNGDVEERVQGSDGTFNCALPECSGGGCCNEEDTECVTWCKDTLDLKKGEKAYNRCIALEKTILETIVERFDAQLKEPLANEIKDFTTPDIELICGAVKGLDPEILLNLFKGYTQSEAQLILQWLVARSEALNLFKNVTDKETRARLFRTLLHRASSASGNPTHEGVLAGLATTIETNYFDERGHIIHLAFDKNNKELFQFIYDEIITDEEEGLCMKKNRPEPTDQLVMDCTDKDTRNPDGEFYPVEHASDFAEEACILAVYCHVSGFVNFDQSLGDHRIGDSEFRERVSEMLGGDDSAVFRFIREPEYAGGLGRPCNTESEEGNWMKQSEEWAKRSCNRVQSRWKNGSLNFPFLDTHDGN